jgi:hypothetical protein
MKQKTRPQKVLELLELTSKEIDLYIDQYSATRHKDHESLRLLLARLHIDMHEAAEALMAWHELDDN